MTRTVPIMAALVALAACDRSPPEPRVTIEEAIVTLPAVLGRPGAAYFTLRTNQDPTRLEGITSPRMGRIELHHSVTANGMTRMAPLTDTRFAPDEPLRFGPGGRHAMLFDLDPTLRPGDAVTLNFTFDPAPPASIEAPVRAAGDVARAGH
ncbi:MAG: copper chaperone PCu(A)C [Allosphingosinicella sp.]